MAQASGIAGAVDRLIAGTGPVADKSILVLLPDRTRPFPFDRILPHFANALRAAGADPGRTRFAIASGTHVPDEMDLVPFREMASGPNLLGPLSENRMVSVGTTSRGTDVRVHPALLEADLVFSLDVLALHYFAGFGGGGKMLFPGLGARASIARNHRLSLAPEHGLAPGVEPGRTIDNPVWLDLREAHHMLPLVHHLTLLPLDEGYGSAIWSSYEEFDRHCAQFADRCRGGERHAADVVLAFAQGAVSIDVVQAHKALFHAALFAKAGAEIHLSAECPEGVGSPALARWLTRPNRDRLERDARTAYDLNAQTAISLAAIAERTRVTWYSPEPLPELEPWGIRVLPDPEGIDGRATEARSEGKAVVRLEHPTRRIPLG